MIIDHLEVFVPCSCGKLNSKKNKRCAYCNHKMPTRTSRLIEGILIFGSTIGVGLAIAYLMTYWCTKCYTLSVWVHIMQLNRHINPRVLVIGLLEDLDSRPLTLRELELVCDSLRDCGVDRAFERFSDDCQPYGSSIPWYHGMGTGFRSILEKFSVAKNWSAPT